MTAEQDHVPQGGHAQTGGSLELEQDLATIEREARRIIELARAAPDLAVPQYPTWTLRDLLLHVAGVHGRTAEICLRLPQERIPTPELPRRSDPFQWATVQLELMLEGLRRADTDAEVWSFVPDRRLAVWRRRMVVEVASTAGTHSAPREARSRSSRSSPVTAWTSSPTSTCPASARCRRSS